MRRITTNRVDCLRVVGWEGELMSTKHTADNRRAGRPNATCFSDIGGISEVERGWGLSLRKERRKAGWLQKGGEHPSAAQYSGWTAWLEWFYHFLALCSEGVSVAGRLTTLQHFCLSPVACLGDSAGGQQQAGSQHPPPQQQYWGGGRRWRSQAWEGEGPWGWLLCFATCGEALRSEYRQETRPSLVQRDASCAEFYFLWVLTIDLEGPSEAVQGAGRLSRRLQGNSPSN